MRTIWFSCSTRPSAETITVVLRKECKMNKTNNPFYKKEGRKWVPVNKVETKNRCYLSLWWRTYEERVNENLKADGSTNQFQGEGVAVGRVVHREQDYQVRRKLLCALLSDLDNQGTKEYLVDGKPATAEQLKLIMSGKSRTRTTSESVTSTGKDLHQTSRFIRSR